MTNITSYNFNPCSPQVKWRKLFDPCRVVNLLYGLILQSCDRCAIGILDTKGMF